MRTNSSLGSRGSATDDRPTDEFWAIQDRQWWGLVSLACMVFLVSVAYWVSATLRSTHGLVFPFDDPYIHLSIAKNLAYYGTWGISPGHFESGSSSPLWIGLLALLMVFRIPGEWAALGINIAAGVWLLTNVCRLPVVRRVGSLPVAMAVAVLAPMTFSLAGLAAMGMEHVLHTAVMVELLVVLVNLLRDPDGVRGRRARYLLPALLLVATALRFETLAVLPALFVVSLVASSGRRWVDRLRQPLIWSVASLIPVGLVAATNVAFGQYLLPDSVVEKGTLESAQPFASSRLHVLVTDPRFGALTLISVGLAFAVGPNLRKPGGAALLTAVLTVPVLVAVGPATANWLGRYQAFAAAMLLFGAMLAATQFVQQRSAIVLLLLLAIIPVPGQLQTESAVVDGSREIHAQHEGAVAFLNLNYPSQTVALNDPGVISYRFNGQVVDLLGVVSHDVLVARRGHTFDRSWVARRLADSGASVAVGYRDWIGGDLPADWVRVGDWCLEGAPITVAGRCLSWWSAPALADDLRARLSHFAPSLSPAITWAAA